MKLQLFILKIMTIGVYILFFSLNLYATKCEKKLYTYDNISNPLNLFYIVKSNNKNTVFYDINLLDNGTIDPKEPIINYWLMFDEKGQKEPITKVENKLAFGITNLKQIIPYKEYIFKIVAMDRDITIKYTNKCPIALTIINGKLSKLEKITLELKGPVFFSSLVYMDIYGQDLKTGNNIVERWYNKD